MAKTVELTLDLARQMHQGENPELRALAEHTYPELKGKITDRVKNFSDALAIHGTSPELQILLDYNGSNELLIAAKNFTMACIVADVLNEGWKADWNNSSEWKYYPWFRMGSSGVGFSYDAFGGDGGFSAVGSRLCFKSSDLAKYAGTQFIELYKNYMTIK